LNGRIGLAAAQPILGAPRHAARAEAKRILKDDYIHATIGALSLGAKILCPCVMMSIKLLWSQEKAAVMAVAVVSVILSGCSFW
jgi:hypothetical protein